MAITKIANPQRNVTVYNPVVFVVDSDNKNRLGFRYIFEIYDENDIIGSYQIAPAFDTGYGVLYADRLLQNYVSYDFANTTTGSTVPNNSYIDFEVIVGESYGSEWNYDDYQFFSSTGFYNAYTELVDIGSGTTHNYNVGDQIFISQSDEPNSLFPQLSGLHTVVEVPSAYSIVIDLVYQYVNSGVTISGLTTFADNRRIVTNSLATFSGHTGINGAVPSLTKFLDSTAYSMTGATADKKFMTTAPSGLRKTRDEDMWFNVINNESPVAFYLRIVNSDGDIFRMNIASPTSQMIQVPVGPNNIYFDTLISGSGPIIKPTTTSYEFWVSALGNAQVSEKFTVNIDDRCPILYNNNYARIVFLDRLGSFGSFALTLRKQENTQISRESYNKQNGFVNGSAWDYDLTETGQIIFNTALQTSLVLNSNWMTQEEGFYFDQMISSPVTFINIDGVYQRCTVLDSSFETSYQRNKRLIRKTININISNPDIINI